MSDPDETTRIPKEALEGLRDADQAREVGRPANGSSGSAAGSSAAPPVRDPAPASPKPANGSSSGSRSGGYPPDGSAAVPSGGSAARTPLFGPGSTGSGLGSGLSSGPGANGSPASGGSAFRSESAAAAPGAAPPAASSPIGYPERSQTGYSPAAYQGSYSAYPSRADAPTAVSGHGAGPVAGAAAGAAAARSSLGTAGRPSPVGRGGGSARTPRRARLLVRHIDPWSTLKFSFVLSVAMFFVWLVAIGVLYGVLDGMGVFEQINGLYDEVSGNAGDRLFSPGLVLGSATVVGAVNIVLFTALATIGAFVYNICADLVGGIEVTLAERD